MGMRSKYCKLKNEQNKNQYVHILMPCLKKNNRKILLGNFTHLKKKNTSQNINLDCY